MNESQKYINVCIIPWCALAYLPSLLIGVRGLLSIIIIQILLLILQLSAGIIGLRLQKKEHAQRLAEIRTEFDSFRRTIFS